MDETSTNLSEFFDEQYEFGDVSKLSADDLFTILQGLDDDVVDFPPLDETTTTTTSLSRKENDKKRLATQKSTSSSTLQELSEENSIELENDGSFPKTKRQKTTTTTAWSDLEGLNFSSDGQGKISHITVERNRRKQMNEHLTVLRSLMPCFYVKRGDQASIIGGVVDYINELQQVLHSLEAKKQRKIYNEVLSPRLAISSSPRPSPTLLSPRSKPPLSPRLSVPVSPRTPQPGSPYKPRLHQQQQGFLINEPSPTSSTTTTSSSCHIINDNINELCANSKSEIADVEVKFSGPNVLLKTVSPRIRGQSAKIIAALEDLSLEILNVNVSTVEDTMFNSFTIKIGIECQLSAEELAHQIQQTFCQVQSF